MANVINFNPEYPDIFLGIKEKAGTFPNDKGEDVSFHNFLIGVALHDVEIDSNTVSCCGYEALGFVNADGKLKDKSKVKAEDMARIFGCEIFSAEQLEEKKFQNCEVLFDKKGNIKRITFEEPLINTVKPAKK